MQHIMQILLRMKILCKLYKKALSFLAVILHPHYSSKVKQTISNEKGGKNIVVPAGLKI